MNATKIQLPNGETVNLSGGGGYELVHSETLQEEAKTLAVGGDLDKYGMFYVYVMLPASSVQYSLFVSYSNTSTFNWTNTWNSSVPAEYPFYFRGECRQEDERAYISNGGASRYSENANPNKTLVPGYLPKYFMMTANTDGVMLPIGSHVEIYGIRRVI